MGRHLPTPNGTEMTGATALVKGLEAAGVDVMFGLPGGAILPAYNL
jgi:acetolactate synthase I/II/III large subunit